MFGDFGFDCAFDVPSSPDVRQGRNVDAKTRVDPFQITFDLGFDYDDMRGMAYGAISPSPKAETEEFVFPDVPILSQPDLVAVTRQKAAPRTSRPVRTKSVPMVMRPFETFTSSELVVRKLRDVVVRTQSVEM